jgi:tetratricopeptide (TPR) repeat protein
MHALLIFAAALAVRLVHIWQIKPSPFFDILLGDANGYDQWAQRLAAGDWVGSDVFYQAPLYPYFLGLVYKVFGRDLLVVRIIQAVIGSASCALLGIAGARFFSKPVGWIAGLALALWAPAIFFDGLLQKSVLDVFFVCLALWLIARIAAVDPDPDPGPPAEAGGYKRYWVALGGAMGALALTRENALVFIVVILAWILVDVWRAGASAPADQRRLKPSLSERLFPFAAGLLLVLAPVVARNYAVDGGFYLTTSQFGSNFYIGNNPQADGTYASIRFGRGAPEFERSDATEVAEAATGRKLSPSEVSSYWTARALGFITSEPAAWLRLMGRKVLLLINRTEMLDTESQESYAAWSAPIAIGSWFGHFGLLVPLAVLGVIVTWPDRQRLWILYGLTLTYALSVVMFYVFARYRYPLVPFLLLFAAAGLWQIKQALQSWQILGAVLVIAMVANVSLLSPALMQAITENNLGTALQEQQRYDEAIRHHERAIGLVPDYAPAYNNLGAALRAAGRVDEAVVRYRKALELRPDFPSASYNLANALLAQGQAGASAEQFQKTLAISPQSVEAQNNLGIALAGKGDAAGAIAAFRAALAIDDRSVHAHRNLGNMLIDAGARAEGFAHLERAIALAPTEPDAIYDIGTVLLEDQNFAAAAARFEAALKVKPDWPEAHNNLGIALASQGRLAQALTHFERAVQLRPDFADARANRDQARMALKK